MSLTEKTDIRDLDEKVVEIEMERLRNFTNHPFKIIGDSQMIELQDSIKKYVFINKQVERVSKEAVEELDSKEVILIFPSQRKNNKTVRVLKTPKTDTSERKVYIPGFVAQCLIDIKKEQDEVKEALGSEYTDYNLIMATTFGMPINGSYIRDQMQKVIDKEGLPDMHRRIW